MNTRFSLPLFALLLCFVSCKDMDSKKSAVTTEAASKKLVKIKGEYGLMLPDYMTQSNGMNADASLQYASIFKRQYVVVIDEPRDVLIERLKESNLWHEGEALEKQLADIQLNNPASSIRLSAGAQSRETIGGLPAVTAEATGRMEGMVQGFHYYLGFLDGASANKVYTIMTWCYDKDIADAGPALKEMLHSFRLLKGNGATAANQ